MLINVTIIPDEANEFQSEKFDKDEGF
jgi:hypothetical protein